MPLVQRGVGRVLESLPAFQARFAQPLRLVHELGEGGDSLRGQPDRFRGMARGSTALGVVMLRPPYLPVFRHRP